MEKFVSKLSTGHKFWREGERGKEERTKIETKAKIGN